MLKDLEKMLELGVIDESTAEAIKTYYSNKKSKVNLFTILGVIGTLLISLGIILIISHNWDNLSISLKTFLSFVPLLISLAICFYSLRYKPSSTTWREAGSVLLFFSIGANYALISQIYHLPGELNSFLFIWLMSAFPIMYIMSSSMSAIFYSLGLAWYALLNLDDFQEFYFWSIILLLSLVLPYYIQLIKKNPKNNYLLYLNYILAFALFINIIGVCGGDHYGFLFTLLLLILLFQNYYFIGKLPIFKEAPNYYNAYLIGGFFGLMVCLFLASFEDVWENEANSLDHFSSDNLYPIVYLALLSLSAIYFLFKYKQDRDIANPFNFAFLVFSILVFLLPYPEFDVIIINLLILGIGIYYVYNGVNKQDLSLLNIGLMTISVLIIIRFIDSDLDYVTKGIIFILLGVGFLLVNLFMIKKFKKHENQI